MGLSASGLRQVLLSFGLPKWGHHGLLANWDIIWDALHSSVYFGVLVAGGYTLAASKRGRLFLTILLFAAVPAIAIAQGAQQFEFDFAGANLDALTSAAVLLRYCLSEFGVAVYLVAGAVHAWCLFASRPAQSYFNAAKA